MQELTFTIPDILLLLGIAQSLYIIIYLLFRSGQLSRGSLPLVYFTALLTAFLTSFLGNMFPELSPQLKPVQWALWNLQPPLSTLLIIQVAQIHKLPAWKHYWVLLLIPMAYIISKLAATNETQLNEWLSLSGLIAGALSFTSLWFNRAALKDLTKQKHHKERYWLILTLIFVNALYISFILINIGVETNAQKIAIITTLFGLLLAYLTSTSLLRIYPQALQITEAKQSDNDLSASEKEITAKIETLIKRDKVYQEPSYSRSDLARECEAPEATISKVLNVHFKQSFPQLMNQYRIEEAKHLLADTEEPMTVIATESGFNSLATFNRVFKKICGIAPSTFRENKSR